MKILHFTIIVILITITSSIILSDAHAQTGMVGETGYTPNWFLKHEGDSNTLSVIRGESNGGSFPNGTGYVDVVFHGYIGKENAMQPVIIKTLYKNTMIRTSLIPTSTLDLNNGTFIFRPHLILYHQNDTYTLQFSYGNQTVMQQYPYVFGNVGHLIFSSNYRPPLWQFMVGVPANDVTCETNLQLVIKAENGSPACVKSSTLTELVSRGWGFDPSNPLDITGLRDSYAVGEIINFQVKFNEMIGDCTEPSVWVMNQTNQTVWKSKEITVPCPPDLTLHHAEGEMKFGNSELGYLSINQTGTYYIHVWFGKEITKKISII